MRERVLLYIMFQTLCTIIIYVTNTVYPETFALLNFCEFPEFNSIVKISLANF